MHDVIPHELHTITPYCTVEDADALIAFVQAVFDGEVVKLDRSDDGAIGHARIRIGDSVLMLNQAGANYPANDSQLHVYVADVEAAYDRAIEAGAIVLMEPNTRPHGDRMAGVRDPQRNTWWIASRTAP